MKNFLLERLSLYLQTKSSGAMKKIVCLLISAFLFCFCSAQNRADDSSCYNMNIDSVKGGNPILWKANAQHSDYVFSLDSIEGQGYCLSIKSPDEKKSYFGSWSNTISERFDGRKLTLSGYIKTEAVNNGYAGIWIRVDPDVSFANMNRNGVKGDSDWKRYELTVPYSQSAEQIVFGGMLIGDGQAWFDNFSISIDGVPLCQLNVRAVNAPEKSDSVFYGQLLHGGLSDSQAMRLFDLCKLWGAMKYTHPDVMNGDIDIDVELAKILPAVINAGNEDSIPVFLREWCKPSNISGTDNGVAPEWAYSNTSAYVKDLINSFWSADFSRESHYIRLERNSVPNFQHEKKYEDMPFPSQPLQILSLFRFWNAVQYYYPNIGSIPNWDDVLKEYIPIFMNVHSKQEYISSLNRLSHEIFDGHSQVYAESDPYRMLYGAKKPDLKAKFISGQLYVSSVGENVYGIAPGDRVISINGQGVSEIFGQRQDLTTAANQGAIQLRISEEIFRTDEDSLTIVLQPTDNSAPKERTIPTFSTMPATSETTSDTCYKEIDGVGYIDVGNLRQEYLGPLWNSIKRTKALIIDLRPYPNEYILYRLGDMLADGTYRFAKIRQLRTVRPRDFEIIDAEPLRGSRLSCYKNPVYVIIDESTFSQSEYTALALTSLPNAKSVGRQTSGTDGDISTIWLPGGVLTGLSGVSVLDSDGNPTYRVGLIPDIEIQSTVEELKDGTDAILNYVLKL